MHRLAKIESLDLNLRSWPYTTTVVAKVYSEVAITQTSRVLKPKNLLNQLAYLEDALNSFSFEELSTSDAKRIKTSFDTFKNQLEHKVFGQESEPDYQKEIETRPDSTNDGEHGQELLIATVSHEIRTPLSGIIGFTDLLRETNLNKEQEEQVKAIRAASNNVMDIINELISPAADQDAGIVDLKQALEDSMGDITVLRELVRLYKQNAIEFIGKVKVYMDQEDFVKIRDAAHKIKCGLAMLKTHGLHFIVEQIHNNCRTTKDLEHLRRLYARFIQKYHVVEKAMDKELDELELNGF